MPVLTEAGDKRVQGAHPRRGGQGAVTAAELPKEWSQLKSTSTPRSSSVAAMSRIVSYAACCREGRGHDLATGGMRETESGY